MLNTNNIFKFLSIINTMKIYWDVDGTLRDNSRLTFEGIYNTLKEHGIEIPKHPIKIYKIWTMSSLEAIQNNQDEFKTFIENLSKKYNFEIDPEKIRFELKNYIHDRIAYIKPYSYVKKALSMLSEYEHGIISMAKKGSTLEWLKRFNLDKYFNLDLVHDGVKSKEPYMEPNSIYIGDSITDYYDVLEANRKNKNIKFFMIKRYTYDGLIKDVHFVKNALEVAKLL
jgi:phosphoglycolate phosphatase-like HAD superfamily hydrolase